MEDLSVKIMCTAIMICFYSVLFMKFNDFYDLPFWASSAAVIVFFISVATVFFSAIIAIWA